MTSLRDLFRIRVLATCVMVAGTAIAAGPAFAHTYTHRDAVHDVRHVNLDQTTAHLSSKYKPADIKRLKVSFTPQRVTVIAALRSVSMKGLKYRTLDVSFKTSRQQQWSVIYEHTAAGDFAVLDKFPVGGPNCDVPASESAGTATMRFSFKSSCIKRPRWIRVAAQVTVVKNGSERTYHDDALRRGWNQSTLTWSGRISNK